MVKAFSLVVAILCSFFSTAQQVKFVVQQLPSYHSSDEPLYLAGSFNNWNPAHGDYKFFSSSGNDHVLTIPLPKGLHEFKITRGSWKKVESAEGGIPAQNRQVNVTADTTVMISILHWGDHFPGQPKLSTANKNVHIIDTAFFIPQLSRYRRIWIYLPESYNVSREKYPVLYMHDGQNVFDNATSFSGEWGVDEAMDTLGKMREAIVVAVDNGGDKRMNEYSSYDMERFGKGEGDQYVDFLVKTLKPYIEKKYRIKKCRKHHFIAGSSMGGLISLYAVLKYPKVFGGAGVFSPAFWIVPSLKNEVAKKAKKIKGKIYFYAGMHESESMVSDMLGVFEQMSKLSKAKMTSVIRAEGKHNESTWRQEFPLFYKWIMKPPSP